MSLDRPTRIDRVLPGLFTELANARTPDYLEAAIEQASSRPQRPAWTFFGRWIPMEITTKAAPAAHVPWRTVGILALVALLVATAAIVVVGSRQRTPAPPFGLAGNGSVAFELDGDIVTVDQATGTITPISTGPEFDTAPAYSPDGTRIAFQRAPTAGARSSVLMVAKADGSRLVKATPEPFDLLYSWRFSPSGNELLVTASVDSLPQMAIVTIDGSTPPRRLEIALPNEPEDSDFRPPDGREILVLVAPGGGRRGLVAVDVETGMSRRIVTASADTDLFDVEWSPTGDRIIYHRFPVVGDGPRARVWIVGADGTNDHQLDVGRDTAYDFAMTGFSNAGTRLLVLSGLAPDGGDELLTVVSADGAGVPVELQCGATEPSPCAGEWIWSPDDTTLLGTLIDESGAVRYVTADPMTGVMTPTTWSGDGAATWQRSAP